MTLSEVPVGSRVRVVGHQRPGACQCASAIAAMGIHPGDEIRVIRAAPFHGPVLVEVPSSGVRLALGRGMARSLIVEPLPA